MKIGITFGCFIPMHEGHKSMIQRSRAENDMTIIAVCGKDLDRGKNFIPFKHRITLVEWKYCNYEDVKVVAVDDDKIGMDGTFTLNNWIIWANELFDNAGLDPNDENEYTWYTGDSSYKYKLEIAFPNHKFTLLDRSVINISGTAVRENPEKYRYMIDPLFVIYLEQKGLLKHENQSDY